MRTEVLLSSLLALAAANSPARLAARSSSRTSTPWVAQRTRLSFSPDSVATTLVAKLPRGGQGRGDYYEKDDKDPTGGNNGGYYQEEDPYWSKPSSSQSSYNDGSNSRGEARYYEDDRDYYDDRGTPSRRRDDDDGGGGMMSKMPNIIKTGNRKIGVPLLGIGAALTILGVSLFFNKTLMRLGNLFFVAGVPMTIGPGRTAGYFFQPKKARATACLAVGIVLVFVGWPVLGIVLEVFGLLNLFGNMFPLAMAVMKTMPVIGPLLRGDGRSKKRESYGGRGDQYYEDDRNDRDSYYEDRSYQEDRGDQGGDDYNQQYY